MKPTHQGLAGEIGEEVELNVGLFSVKLQSLTRICVLTLYVSDALLEFALADPPAEGVGGSPREAVVINSGTEAERCRAGELALARRSCLVTSSLSITLR